MKIKIHSSCDVEDFVETHFCKLSVILRSLVLRGVCLYIAAPLYKRAHAYITCNMYMYNCDFFFFLRAHLFVLAPLSQTSGGVGTI